MANLGDPNDRLAGNLLAEAKRLRKDWETLVLDGDNYPGQDGAPAQPGVRVVSRLWSAGQPGYAYTISLRSQRAASGPLASWLVNRLRDFAAWKDESFPGGRVSFLVLDGRAVPGDLLEALRWVAPPEDDRNSPDPVSRPLPG